MTGFAVTWRLRQLTVKNLPLLLLLAFLAALYPTMHNKGLLLLLLLCISGFLFAQPSDSASANKGTDICINGCLFFAGFEDVDIEFEDFESPSFEVRGVDFQPGSDDFCPVGGKFSLVPLYAT